jgi:hypothetical protein
VHAFTGIGVFVERIAVEATQTVFVGREMRRYPVDQHAQTGGMAGADELAEAGRAAVTGGGGVKPERLIAPGTVEGMFGNRQQLKMGEAQVDDVGDQRFGQALPVGKAAIVGAPPGSQVHFVDRQRRAEQVAGRDGHGCDRWRQGADHRGRRWPQLGFEAVGIGLEGQQMAVARADFVFVTGAGAHPGQEDLPGTTFAAQAHRVATAVPVIEVTDDADPLGVRRPDGECRSGDAVDFAEVRAEALEGAQVRTFGE